MQMKNFLAIDTANEYLTVIACKGGKAQITFEADCAMQHSVRLMDAVEDTLAKAALSPAECDFFCAVTGPGSFTGIRIGISAIKGFAAATGKPVLGVTSFTALAYNAKDKALSVVPAGRGRYYVCGFTKEKEICLAPCEADEEKIVSLAKEYMLYSFAPLPFVKAEKADPAGGLLAAIEAGKETDFGKLSAFYLKKSQAEEEREKKQSGSPIGRKE